jgi:hypothetical protein
MTATLVVFTLLLAVLAWLFLGSRGATNEPPMGRRHGVDRADSEAGIDRAELEAAERDVRDAASEDEVKDWGPGAGQPRPPERL